MNLPQNAMEWADPEPAEFGRILGHIRKSAPPDRVNEAIFAALRLRFRYRIDEFMRFCWPGRFELPFNEMHGYLFEISDVLPYDQRKKPDILEAVAAPRGMGKSSLSSFGVISHDIAYDNEAFIVLISSARELAWDLSFDLISQFKPPPNGAEDDRRFTRLYGPFNVVGGKSAWQVSVQGRPTVAVTTRSFGQAIRGIKHPGRGIRPTKVVIDDGEDKNRVRSPEQREVWQSTLSNDILKLSARHTGTVFQFVGTILHPDSILNRRMKDPGWRSKRFAAILAWPSNRDLWEECRQIWCDLERGDQRRTDALAFYHEHRAEMDEGAELLDPVGMPLFQLYELIWAQGYASFLKEMQNEPIDPNVQIFHSETFTRFDVRADDRGSYLYVHAPRPRIVRFENLVRKFIQWDPAGGDLAGDYAAIACVARDNNGYKYVLGVWMAKRKPSIQREALWTMAEQWEVRQSAVESNGFADLVAEPFERERIERREGGQFWRLEVVRRPASSNKEERIASSEPEISNGWLAFNSDTPREVFAQYDQFPSGDHDDGPDAIQAAASELGSAGEIGMTGGR